MLKMEGDIMEGNGLKGALRVMVGMILLLSLIQIFISDTRVVDVVSGESTWTLTSDVDFNEGTTSNLEILETGSEAELALGLNFDGEWIQMSYFEKPDERRGHVTSSIFDTDKVLLFGGWDGDYLQDTWTYDLSEDEWNNMDPPDPKPNPRHTHDMAFIWGTDKVLLFGGCTVDDENNETWLYDLSDNTWTQKAFGPTGRKYHALASIYYDDKVVLFSGFDGNDYVDDTWVYDLSDDTWTQMSPSTSPSARKGHEMASIYDTDKIVLFGGNVSGTHFIDDTWVYDLSEDDWTDMNPASDIPSPRRGHGMSSLYETDKVVIFGGYSDVTSYVHDTWVYDSGDNIWTLKEPPTSPSPRYITHGIASIYNDDKAMLFGGGFYDGMWYNFDDTWIYDLSEDTWTEMNPASNPKGRRGHVLSSISDTDLVLLFGGYDGDYLEDTWVYDLSEDKWTQKEPTIPRPAGRHSHAMAPIYGTDNVLLFGGYTSGGLSNETWLYDLSDDTWTQKSYGPSAREYHEMSTIYDDDKVVLFGGYDGNDYLDDIWVYDLNDDQWTQMSPFVKPSARKGHEMATVYGTDEIVLFGGNESGTALVDDTWVYDLSLDKWTDMNPSGTRPSPRRGHGMGSFYDTDEILLFGPDDQTWIYDFGDNTWTLKTPAINPGPRYITHGIAAISTDDKVMLFGGGYNDGIWHNFDDTWIYDLASYEAEGTFLSPPFQIGTEASLKKLTWDAETPDGTSIKLQLRSAATDAGLDSEVFVGSDGSEETYYTDSSGEPIWNGHEGDCWVQYKAYFVGNAESTPRLQQVTIIYNHLPEISSLTAPEDGIWTNDNAPVFTWEFSDLDGSQGGFQIVIDSVNGFEDVDYDSGEQISSTSSWQFPEGTEYTEIQDGTWYWKVRTQDNDGEWGAYSNSRSINIDTQLPGSMISVPEDGGLYSSLPSISGMAYDTTPGSGIGKVEITIKRLNDEHYWSGANWISERSFLLVEGTTDWDYDSNSVIWTQGAQYEIKSIATDLVNNVEIPGPGIIISFDSPEPPIPDPDDDINEGDDEGTGEDPEPPEEPPTEQDEEVLFEDNIDDTGSEIDDKVEKDLDGDGIEDDKDAFPYDPAASVDSDEDGYPDSWNTGKSEADSTTDLKLDELPDDPTKHSLKAQARITEGEISLIFIMVAVLSILLGILAALIFIKNKRKVI
jgi:N-acetylneuraminic acid mutarotase